MSFSERLAELLTLVTSKGELVPAFLIAVVGGLLTALSPCVYPLIPITIRFFARGTRTSWQLWLRALVYVLAMVLLYATLGTAAAASHSLFGSLLGSSYVTLLLALFCVAMGVSMLGAFTLQLPASLTTRLSQVGGSHVIGAISMGLVAGLIAAPCTGPVLAVILTYIATLGDLTSGFAMMTAFGFGLGLPFLLLALSSGRLWGRLSPGVWMEVVKTLLASAMFTMAMYYLRLTFPRFQPFLDSVVVPLGLLILLFLAALIIAYAIVRYRKAHLMWRASLVAVLSILLVLMLFANDSTSTRLASTGGGIVWQRDMDAAMHTAQVEQRPVIIDFTADWCEACHELERKTYLDPRVIFESRRFVMILLDVSAQIEESTEWFDRYDILGLPAVLFINKEGKLQPELRVNGYVNADRFLTLMQHVE